MGTWGHVALLSACVTLGGGGGEEGARERRATVRGLVRDAAGAPVEGAWVLLESEGGVAHDVSTRSDPTGRFELATVGPGPFHVEARVQGPSGVLVRSARGVEPEATLVLEVVPTAAVQVVVRGKGPRDSTGCVVRDAAGRLVWHEFEGIEGARPHVGSFETTTGHRVSGLEPGVYGLEVEADDPDRAAWVRVEVRAGEEKALALELRPATFLVVQALEDGREVPSWLTVEAANGLRQQTGHGVCVRADYELATLPPGEYRLIVERGERRGEEKVVLRGEPERTVRIALE